MTKGTMSVTVSPEIAEEISAINRAGIPMAVIREILSEHVSSLLGGGKLMEVVSEELSARIKAAQ